MNINYLENFLDLRLFPKDKPEIHPSKRAAGLLEYWSQSPSGNKDFRPWMSSAI